VGKKVLAWHEDGVHYDRDISVATSTPSACLALQNFRRPFSDSGQPPRIYYVRSLQVNYLRSKEPQA
jgi:hypothetical protein